MRDRAGAGALLIALAALIAAVVAVTGCTPGAIATTAASTQTAGSLPPGGDTTPIPAPGTCHLGSRNGQDIPDPSCTPGALNPDVTQANIGSTICRSGWTKTVRPNLATTKRRIIAAYDLPAGTNGELDHDVSLELGGAPSDPRNLWIEPGKVPNHKDPIENQLNDAVCSGLITLSVAQHNIAADWTTSIPASGLTVTHGRVCLREQPARCAVRG